MNLNFADMFGKIQQMQDEMKKMRERLDDMTVDAEAGGGMVKVTANGAKRVLKIQIDTAQIGDDKEMLEDLVTAAVNKALDKAEELHRTEMAKMTQSMMPPGMGGLPGMDLSKFGL